MLEVGFCAKELLKWSTLKSFWKTPTNFLDFGVRPYGLLIETPHVFTEKIEGKHFSGRVLVTGDGEPKQAHVLAQGDILECSGHEFEL